MKSIKNLVKRLLRKHNKKLIYVPANEVTGVDLIEDLQSIIATCNPVLFDIGANQGQTIDFLLKAFPAAQIHAFEPSTSAFSHLKSTFQSPQIHLHKLALGSKVEKREFINYESSVLSSFLSLAKDPANRFRNIAVKEKEIVNVETIDHFMKERNIPRIDLLKTDTQGFDLEVLRGSIDALQSRAIENILLEMNFVEIYEKQGTPAEIIDLLLFHRYLPVDFYEKIRRDNSIAWCNVLFKRQ